jgi:amidase
MVPAAIGTQTVGSVLRPAAYCGIVGLKPSHGRIPLEGAWPLAPSLDHAGILARSVSDAALVLGALMGRMSDPVRRQRAPRLGLVRALHTDRADGETAAHLDEVSLRLAKAGAELRPLPAPFALGELLAAGQTVLRAEAAAQHRSAFAAHRDEYAPQIRALLESGLQIAAVDYLTAQQARREFARKLAALLEDLDALLLPVAPSAAPAGLGSTGDASLCAPASFAGLPAIALPSGLAASGLPLAVQLVAPPLAEASMLEVAAWAERVLEFQARPALP